MKILVKTVKNRFLLNFFEFHFVCGGCAAWFTLSRFVDRRIIGMPYVTIPEIQKCLRFLHRDEGTPFGGPIQFRWTHSIFWRYRLLLIFSFFDKELFCKLWNFWNSIGIYGFPYLHNGGENIWEKNRENEPYAYEHLDPTVSIKRAAM